MAEHVFESPLVEEFYNSCHLKANGKFCGTGTKAKVAKQVPMSANARKSNAILRSNAAARKSKAYKGTVKAIKGVDKAYAQAAAKRKAARKAKQMETARPTAGAMNLTNKYGTRRRGA